MCVREVIGVVCVRSFVIVVFELVVDVEKSRFSLVVDSRDVFWIFLVRFVLLESFREIAV